MQVCANLQSISTANSDEGEERMLVMSAVVMAACWFARVVVRPGWSRVARVARVRRAGSCCNRDICNVGNVKIVHLQD